MSLFWKLLPIFILIGFFCLSVSSYGEVSLSRSTIADTVAVLVNVIDCSTKIPLEEAEIIYDYYDHDLLWPRIGGGIRTDKRGNLTLAFDTDYLGHIIYYRIMKTDYFPDSGSFILETGFRLSVCLQPVTDKIEPKKVVEEKQPFIFRISVKDSATGSPIDSVFVFYVFKDKESSARCHIDTILLVDSSDTVPTLTFKLPEICACENPISYRISKAGYQSQVGVFQMKPNEFSNTYYLAPLPSPIKEKARRSKTFDILAGITLVGMYVGMLVLTGSI